MDAFQQRLKAVIEERLRVAREATPGPWWDSKVLAAPGHHTIRGGPDEWRGFDGSLGGDTRPVARIEPAPDYEGGFVTNHDADVEHIALNDPADAILAGEWALGVLERHRPDDYGGCVGCHFDNREERWLWADCAEIAALATRYGVSTDG